MERSGVSLSASTTKGLQSSGESVSALPRQMAQTATGTGNSVQQLATGASNSTVDSLKSTGETITALPGKVSGTVTETGNSVQQSATEASNSTVDSLKSTTDAISALPEEMTKTATETGNSVQQSVNDASKLTFDSSISTTGAISAIPGEVSGTVTATGNASKESGSETILSAQGSLHASSADDGRGVESSGSQTLVPFDLRGTQEQQTLKAIDEKIQQMGNFSQMIKGDLSNILISREGVSLSEDLKKFLDEIKIQEGNIKSKTHRIFNEIDGTIVNGLASQVLRARKTLIESIKQYLEKS
ncbi:MAG: hypothetical protein JSS09_09465 [Verrucomicrobia bacterium]|nr:hypothetical protein [Verrucomicrobiota bacterium]